jgi:hypothetical protein
MLRGILPELYGFPDGWEQKNKAFQLTLSRLCLPFRSLALVRIRGLSFALSFYPVCMIDGVTKFWTSASSPLGFVAPSLLPVK